MRQEDRMIGRQLSQFRVQRLIGQGGMGDVYLADDLSLNRRVALKFVTGGATDPDAGRRILHEARAIAALDHPFLCKVYSVGDNDGCPYLAMEYIDGLTLHDRLLQGPLPVADAVRFAIEIAEAMECAHARGIIHRDLKPANVMLAADGHVRVMDFGIASRVPIAGLGDLSTRGTVGLAESGTITGTVAYMSPEQLRALPLDVRSDVFAFGILLYEMVTGVHPFQRESLVDTIGAVISEAPAPLRVAGPGAPALARVVLRCLEKERERRFGTFQDVRLELQSLATAPDHGTQRPRRSRRWALASVFAACAIGGGAIWMEPSWLHLSDRALAFNPRDWIVIADCENLTGDPVFDRSLAVALEVGIGQSNYVNVYSRDRVLSALQRVRRPPTGSIDLALASDIAQRDGVRAVLTCAISRIGSSYSIAGRIVDPRTERIALTESVTASGRDGVLPALDQLAGRLRRRLGESLTTLSKQNVALPQATTSSLDALKMFAESQRIDNVHNDATADRLLQQAIELDPDFAMAHAVLGHSYFLSSEPATREEGERHIAKALSLTSRLTTRERLLIQASADDAHGNREKAVAGYRSYLSQYPDDMTVWFRLGWTYMAGLKQFGDAIDAFDRVVAIDSKNTAAMINLATCYKGLRQYDRAVDMYHKAFALSPDDMFGMYVNDEYGSVLIQLGRVAEAEAAFTRMASRPETRARGLRSLAFLNMYRGRYSAAIGMLREAIALNQAQDATVSVFRDRLIVTRALLAKGRIDDARRELAQVNALVAGQAFGPEWLAPLVRVQARLGNVHEGERLLGLMTRSVASAVAASSANRSMMKDQGFVELARAEVAAAEQRPGEAETAAAAATARLQDSALDTAAHVAAVAGRGDDAAARYARLIGQPEYIAEEQEDWFAGHIALGGLYESTGRWRDARALYQGIVDLWKDGDDDLLLLKTARTRLAALPQ